MRLRLLAAVALLAAAPLPARADTGPALTVPAATLAASLHCAGDLATSNGTPVLLIHGTTSNAHDNFSWNWDKAFDAAGRAHCDVDLPANGTGDIQTAAEYVVNGIRTMAAAAGGKVSLLGHSQGGMIGRWALKWWPDTRDLVDDYVALAPSNHGTDAAVYECGLTTRCAAADWQQATNSHFIAALDAGPQTWPTVSYTVIYTHGDEIVWPNFDATGRSSLPPGPNVANIAVQELCPTETVDHFGMAYDNAAYLLGIDALTHPGAAVLSRVSTATCGQPFMPSVDPTAFPSNAGRAMAATGQATYASAKLPAEPPLRCYAGGPCP